MSNVIVFPDYIYQDIISSILGYFYNKQTNFELFYYKPLWNSVYSNFTIELSLVCKKWFKYVSKYLTEILNFNNYELLEQFIILPPKSLQDKTIKIKKSKKRKFNKLNDAVNEEEEEEEEEEEQLEQEEGKQLEQENKKSFKLINNYYLVKIYDTINEYDEENDCGNNKKFNKILLMDHAIENKYISVLNGSKQFPSNVELNLKISINDIYNSKTNSSDSNDLKQIFKTNENYNINEIKPKINKLKIKQGIISNNGENINNSLELVKNIIQKLEPKSINYFTCEDIYDQSILFESNEIESLEISNNENHTQPRDISKINNKLTKLKSLSISIMYHSIIRYLNNCKPISPDFDADEHYDIDEYDYCDYYYKTNLDGGDSNGTMKYNIKEEWLSMVETLSNNQTIKDLQLNNPCLCGKRCIHGLDTTFVSDGLAKVFSSPLTRIQTLQLDGVDYVDSNYLNSLASNKTIQTLILSSIDNLTPIFQKVLSKNRIIRNVLISSKTRCHYIEYLLSSSKLELYSLSFIINRRDNLHLFLNYLLNNNNNNNNIKELNIFTSAHFANNNIKSKYILSNQNIINIIYLKDSLSFNDSFYYFL